MTKWGDKVNQSKQYHQKIQNKLKKNKKKPEPTTKK